MCVLATKKKRLLRVIKRWFVIGLVEIVGSLVALAIAPTFLNSNRPEIGFAIVLGIPTLLTGSAAWVGWRLTIAHQARSRWLAGPGAADPASQGLSLVDFLEIPPEDVANAIEAWTAGQADLMDLQIWPIDLLRRSRRSDRRPDRGDRHRP